MNKLISHRGNTAGPVPEYENKPAYIERAIKLGYDVEVDCFRLGDSIYLGHDKPTYFLGDLFDAKTFLSNPALLIHAKNAQMIEYLAATNLHWFSHENDSYALTSKGMVITFPGKDPIPGSILMAAETFTRTNTFNNHLCSDYIEMFKD